MRLLRLGAPGEERPAVLEGGTARDVSSLVGDFDADFWAGGGVGDLQMAVQADPGSFPEVELSDTRLGAPVAKPSKIICIGLNYLEHIAEAGAEVPDEPVIFLKAPNTVVGPNDDILIPPRSEKTDYEVELAVVLGGECRYLADPDAAANMVGGYAVSNDVSERAYQLERGGQWVKGKSCETFNPLGPYLVAPDEIPEPNNLELTLTVNGELRQSSNTKDMVYPPAYLVWYVSQFMVLEPGDMINTGTPSGVALGMSQPRYLQSGDVVEASITGLGTQRVSCR
jgi:2-keto-4-pentenoate hydratase/2-oxohepta-3-ene-1,7-dioic acid hydratase in catechol pathway